ncbi:MAG TPA: zinc-dependent metalloprotease [Kineosporiaceae bacterium]|nr:zinc-dependent metalloprotease [Kineosporiaceae bacterium]
MSGGEVPERPGDQPDPLGDLFKALFGGSGGLPGGLPPELANLPGMPQDPAALQAMLAQVQHLLSGGGDEPVNWDLAHDTARQVAAEGGDPTVPDAQQRQVAEALRTADLWLDRVTDLPSATARTEAWSRAEWVERTLPTWKGVVGPVAESVSAAMTAAVSGQAPTEAAPMLAGALPMMRRMAGAFFGAQVGQAIGTLAREAVSAGDVGLPLLPAGRAALLPGNVTAFGEGLGLPEDEVRLYLALREAAHARLFSAVGWIRSHLLGAVEEYARGISIDTGKIEAAVREIDPSDPQALQSALASGLFEPDQTPAQQAALERLENALALVEGWVDEVVDRAAQGSLPHADALRETIRRRRAAGGPAEHTFASLVGLELRPRRLREAAAVWAALTQARGAAGRDALWSHPDLAPTSEAFTDPVGFARQDVPGGVGDAMDAALAELLDAAEQQPPSPGSEAPGTTPPQAGPAQPESPGAEPGQERPDGPDGSGNPGQGGVA